MKRLAELNATLKNDVLVFDCPSCGGQNAHRIRVPLKPRRDHTGRAWDRVGTFPETLTLNPSVDAGCWHGDITNGAAV